MEGRIADLQRLGGGREAEVFAWGDGRVLRLAHDPSHLSRIELEARALSAAHRAGAPVPGVYEQVTVDGRPGVIVDRIDGEDLVASLGRRPWLVEAVGRKCGRLHAQLHEVIAPEELPLLNDWLRLRLASALVPEDVRDSASARLDSLPDGDRLCHGDFHPGNVIDGRAGHIVIDWTAAARGDPAADVAQTRLLLLRGELPEDAPPVARRLDRVGRRLLYTAYRRGYHRVSPLDPALLDRWEPVCAAARLAAGIDAEREALLAIARGQD